MAWGRVEMAMDEGSVVYWASAGLILIRHNVNGYRWGTGIVVEGHICGPITKNHRLLHAMKCRYYLKKLSNLFRISYTIIFNLNYISSYFYLSLELF